MGPEHPDTLAARGNLADWTGEAGDAAGARDQFAALLPIVERVGPRTLVHSDCPWQSGRLGPAGTGAAKVGDRLDVDEPYDFFISYSGPDRAWVEALAQGLQSRGIKVFLDQWQVRPGDRVIDKLGAAPPMLHGPIEQVFGDVLEGSWATAEREARFLRKQSQTGVTLFR